MSRAGHWRCPRAPGEDSGELTRKANRRTLHLDFLFVRACPSCRGKNPEGFRFCGSCGASLLRSLDAVPNNLPVQLTSFIGREQEAEDVKRSLSSARLVTLTGSGGCGKTRLSLAVGAELAERFRDGVWYIDLAPVVDASLVAKALATTVSVGEIPNQPISESLTRALREMRMLILLDNCEHVIGACAELTQALISDCPAVSILATSRESLDVKGEVTYRIPSLSFPAEQDDVTVESLSQYDAVRLFVDRARRARPNFQLADETAPAIVEICRRLDGIPLAIELAAARTRVFAPHQIAAALADVFHFLTRGPRTALPRQRTLEASIDWSHELLNDVERVLFRRLAVFAGGFTLDAVETVCSFDGIERFEILDLLTSLVDKSLVQTEETLTEGRLRLLETIRGYAERKLVASGEVADIRNRHLNYFTEFARRAQPELESHAHAGWVEIVQTELDNVRAGLQWSLEQPDGTSGLRIAGALWTFWVARSAAEGHRRIQAALAHPNVDHASRPAALVAARDLALIVGDPGLASACGDEALVISRELGDPRMIARGAMAAGWPKVFLDPSAARPLLEEGATVSESAGDLLCMADCLTGIGFLEIGNGSLVSARNHLEKAVTTSRTCGLPVLIVRALLAHGWNLQLLTNLEDATASIGEALEIASAIREGMWSNICRIELAMVALLRGSIPEARAELAAAFTHAAEIMSGYGIAMSAWGRGQAEFAGGDTGAATAAFTEGLQIQAMVGLRWLEVWGRAALAEVAVLDGDLPGARAHIDEADAVMKSFPSPLAEGRVQHARSAVAWAADDLDAAESAEHEAIQMFVKAEHVQGIIEACERLAGLLAALENFAGAARLLGVSDAARDSIGYMRFPIDVPVFDRAVKRARAAMGDDAFDSAYAEGLGLRLEEAVAYVGRGRGSRKRPSSGWASLTPTELDVVRLVADGLSNADVGKRLFISPRTVQAHLARVFKKLGVSSRTELAAEALRRGVASG